MKTLLALLAFALPAAISFADNTSAPTAAATKPAKLASDLAGNLVSLQGGKLAPLPADKLAGVKYYAIYYSAHWCPPCRAFTPELVKAYDSLKAAHPEFELIFVSSDEDADAMLGYMTEEKMRFPAVRYDQAQSLPATKRYAEEGIPNLVFLTAEGEVLSSSFVKGEYVGPQKVLTDIRKKFSAGN